MTGRQRWARVLRAWKSTTGRELRGTLVANNLVLVVGLLLYRLIAHRVGPLGFGQYQLADGTVVTLLPIILLGLPIALMKYVPRATVNGKDDSRRYLAAAVVFAFGSIAVFGAVTVLGHRVLAHLYFGHANLTALLAATSVLAIGLTFDQLVNAYLRGILRTGWANVLKVVDYGVCPLAAVLSFRNIVAIITALGILVLGVSSVVLCAVRPPLLARGLFSHARSMLSFSRRRALGDILNPAFYVTPTVIVAHTVSIAEAGYVGFGTSGVIFVGALFAFIGTVLLPRLSRAFAMGQNDDSVRRLTGAILAFTTVISVVVTVGAYAFMPFIVRVYAGSRFVPGVPVMRLIVLGSVPFSIYVAQRATVDAAFDVAVISRTLVIAYAGFWLIWLVGRLFLAPATSVGVAYDGAMVLLAVLTMLGVVKALKLPRLAPGGQAQLEGFG